MSKNPAGRTYQYRVVLIDTPRAAFINETAVDNGNYDNYARAGLI